MFVIKRKGTKEFVDFSKVHKRICWLVEEPFLLDNVNSAELTQSVIQGLYNEIETSEIDIYAANLSASFATKHHDYSVLAGRIVVDNHHKNTLSSFRDKIALLYMRRDANNIICPLISDEFFKYVEKNQFAIDKYIDYSRDFKFDFFGFRTLERGYLIKLNDRPIERPQDLFMRVAIQIHLPEDESAFKNADVLDRIFKTYDNLSHKLYTHATPTLFNAGTPKGSFASCFLLGTEDSLDGIMKTLTDCSKISKWSGGIGIHISSWRSEGSFIRGTNGKSSGIVPFLRMFNDAARAFNQGGKRPGSFAVYLEPHHPDILKFLQLRRPQGDENLKCRDLFLALWISDLFMKRVEADELWTTFCPDKCPGLNTCWGDEYDAKYLEYEKLGKGEETLRARDIWNAVFESQKESGMPYMLYKDTINRASMQQNLGTISSSNLCVSGDTLILTDHGYFPIKSLAESNPPVYNVWNGDIFTPATFAKTGENKELLEVKLADDTLIKCTPNHKFIIVSGAHNQNEIIKDAQDLEIGDRVIKYSRPVIDESHGYIKIASITPLEEKEDTYCFNEPIKHRGIFNGILLGNCAEIVEYSDTNEYSTCNLANICLPYFVYDSYTQAELAQSERRPLNHEFPLHPILDYRQLAEIAGELVVNLNNIIDKTWYSSIETARSNFRHRPIGIGVQGLADVFLKFRVPFESEEASILNKKIFEAIYYGAVTKSSELCRQIYRRLNPGDEYYIYPKKVRAQYPELVDGIKLDTIPTTIGAHPSYLEGTGNPLSRGQFHWELYGLTADQLSGMWDWESLRMHIAKFGIRNSLLVALMPTASTSNIMGCSSCFEPYLSNIYKRTTLAGEFIIINKYLMRDLQETGLWSDTMKHYLLVNNGSVQNIDGLPQHMQDLYKTAWEIKQKTIMDLAVGRQPFVDQSQSMNLYVDDFSLSKFHSMQLYAWRNKLKTGCYYLRSRAAISAQKFTVDPEIQRAIEARELKLVAEINTANDENAEDEICLMCQ